MIDTTQVVVDSFLMGICGGFFAFGTMWLLASSYLKYSLRRQMKVIREFRKLVNMKMLSDDLQQVRQEITAIRGFLGGA